MEQKNIVATLYLKNGTVIRSHNDDTEIDDIDALCRACNDSGIDKIILFDLSKDEDEHEKNLNLIKLLNRNLEIKVCAAGNINGIEDIKKLLFAGCLQVMLNGSKPGSVALADEASRRFGKDHIMVSINNVDFLYKCQQDIEKSIHELYVMDSDMMDAVENITNVPYVVKLPEYDYDHIVNVLKRQTIRGISGEFVNVTETDIMSLKSKLSNAGIKMVNFEPDLKWSDLKLNSDGMVPVIVQDYRTDEVLMLAYMNEEAFNTTIHLGKMTYYSRSRKELWTKGLTSGHLQYVKSLTADCDYDTILAKVSQVGVACHTGSRSCFFNNIVKKEYMEKNPLKVLEETYNDIEERRKTPKDGSYTNYLFDKGIDTILKKVGEECTEILIASKNPGSDKITCEISDFLYHCMVLMVEKGVTWEEIANELSQR